jgi:hypothetical protein
LNFHLCSLVVDLTTTAIQNKVEEDALRPEMENVPMIVAVELVVERKSRKVAAVPEIGALIRLRLSRWKALPKRTK